MYENRNPKAPKPEDCVHRATERTNTQPPYIYISHMCVHTYSYIMNMYVCVSTDAYMHVYICKYIYTCVFIRVRV